jgi:muconate cycloisomerase
MKITRIIATEVVVPAHEGAINSPEINRPLHKLAQGASSGWSIQFDQLPKLILELETEDGVIGLGECYRAHNWEIIEAFAQKLLGEQLDSISLQRLPLPFRREYDGFECAVLDARAKSLGVRVVDLLGGPVREHVKIAAWSSHRTLNEIPDLATDFLAQGYDSLKFKCDLDDDVAGWCRAIADAAPGLMVTLDPNERWESRADTMQRLRQLEEIGNVFCLEEPIPRWNLEDMRLIRESSAIPIALHVSLPYREQGQKMEDALMAVKANAVDGFNFNGSASEFQRLSSFADLAGLSCWHGSEVDLGILEARYIHSCAAASACVWPSDIFGRLIRSHDLLEEALEIKPPYAELPKGPGLGVSLDRDAVKHFQTNQRIYTAKS